MNRQPVVSSNISSVGYDEKERVLEVEFSNGSVYQYSDVPKETFEALVSAKSVGAYFHNNVKFDYEYSRM